LQEVTDAYLEQCEAIEAVGGRIVLMASRALAAAARDAEDYASVYARVLTQVKQPVILHWLGPMFDPALEGYWGATAIPEATQNCLNIIRAHGEKIDGIKISLLDADLEVSMRRNLPGGVRMYTGDDFNYDRLILVMSRATAMPCWASSMPSLRRHRWRFPRLTPGMWVAIGNCWRPRCRSPGISLRRRPCTIRRESCSWHT